MQPIGDQKERESRDGANEPQQDGSVGERSCAVMDEKRSAACSKLDQGIGVIAFYFSAVGKFDKASVSCE